MGRSKFHVCYNCKDRTVAPNCHMTCELYLKEVEENKRLRQKHILNDGIPKETAVTNAMNTKYGRSKPSFKNYHKSHKRKDG